MNETKTPTPFVCDNCDYRPTIEEVLHHNGDCPKCHDTISVFTVDAAHQLTAALDARKTAEKRAEDAEKACAEMRDWKAMVFTRLEHHCPDNNHHVRIPIEDWNAMPSFEAGRDYVHKSKLEAAEKACKAMRDAWDKYDSNSSTWADTDHCRKVHQDCKVGSPASFPSQPSPQPRK